MNKITILEQCNRMCKNTMMETMQVEFTDVSDNTLTAKMPVNSGVHQPDGVLHGGAMVALAESVGSAAAYIFLKNKNIYVRGIEISANHVKSVKDGFVYGRATALHIGRTTQLWQIKITNEEGQLISLCKLTTLILPKKK